MHAIMITKETKYACNRKSKTDHLWLQSLPKGPNMLAIIENLFSRDSCRHHYHVTLGPLSTLQAYLVPLEEIAAIHGPFRIWDCKHLVPFKTEIASILGPLRYQHCKHI